MARSRNKKKKGNKGKGKEAAPDAKHNILENIQARFKEYEGIDVENMGTFDSVSVYLFALVGLNVGPHSSCCWLLGVVTTGQSQLSFCRHFEEASSFLPPAECVMLSILAGHGFLVQKRKQLLMSPV